MTMFVATTLALLVTLVLMLIRLVLGPTVFDRLQTVNSIGTVAMLLLATVGFVRGRPEFLDLALVYGFLNIIGTIAVLKFFKYGDLGDDGSKRLAREETHG
jgi:multicomponent Na+:H+ antiporter subunit F